MGTLLIGSMPGVLKLGSFTLESTPGRCVIFALRPCLSPEPAKRRQTCVARALRFSPLPLSRFPHRRHSPTRAASRTHRPRSRVRARRRARTATATGWIAAAVLPRHVAHSGAATHCTEHWQPPPGATSACCRGLARDGTTTTCPLPSGIAHHCAVQGYHTDPDTHGFRRHPALATCPPPPDPHLSHRSARRGVAVGPSSP